MTGGEDRCPRGLDVHVHAVPPPLVERAGAGEYDGVEVESGDRGPAVRFPEADPSPPIPAPMFDPAALAEAGEHVAMQLLSPWTDLFGYTLTEGDASRWSRAYNAALAEQCAGSPRHEALATVPLTYPRLAAEELTAARELGCVGAIVGTDIPGLHLGSPELEPFWEVAANLGMPVLVHPTNLRVPAELRDAGLRNAVGRAAATALALSRLVYSGALVRHPALAVIACHGGGGFAPILPRVLRNHELGWSETEADVGESVARLYFDSVVLDPALLRHLVSTFGADRFVLGSDLPFPWEPRAVETVTEAATSERDRAAVLRENAERLYGVSVGAACTRCSASLAEPSAEPSTGSA